MFPRGRFAPERQTRMSVIRTQEKIFCEKCLEKGKLFSVWKLAKYKLCFMQTRCPLFEKILKTHFQFWNISSEKETIQNFSLFTFFHDLFQLQTEGFSSSSLRSQYLTVVSSEAVAQQWPTRVMSRIWSRWPWSVMSKSPLRQSQILNFPSKHVVIT